MLWPLAINSWDDAEKNAIKRILDNDERITIGGQTAAFEKEFAEFHSLYMGVAVNSGSSANLLAIAVLSVVDNRKGKWIVPALGWATTYAPLHQHGHSLVVVDIDDSLNMDTAWLRKAVTEHPDAIGVMVVNVLGVPADLGQIRQICDQHGLFLVEDNCESLGASVDGRATGTWGDLGTFSFFFSHHLVTGEGGMVLARNPHLYSLCRSLRSHGWTRGVAGMDAPGGRYAPFTFVEPGYNFRMMDLQAAPGREQLKKLRTSIAIRERNLQLGRSYLTEASSVLLPALRGSTSPMAFPFQYSGDMRKLQERLVDAGIENRPIIAGNILRQPVASKYNIISYPTPKADAVHEQGLYVGIHPELMSPALFESLRKCMS